MYKACQSDLINEIKRNNQEIRAHRQKMRRLQQQIQNFGRVEGVSLKQLLKQNQKMKEDIIRKNAELFSKYQQLTEAHSLNQLLKQDLANYKEQNLSKKIEEQLQQKEQIISYFKNQKYLPGKQIKKLQNSDVAVSLVDEGYYQSFIEKINSSIINRKGNPVDARSLFQYTMPILKSYKTSFIFQVVKYQVRHQVFLGVQCHAKSFNHSESNGCNSARTAMHEIRRSGENGATKKICFVRENFYFSKLIIKPKTEC